MSTKVINAKHPKNTMPISLTRLTTQASGHFLLNFLAINTQHKLLISVYDIKLQVQLTVYCLDHK